MTSPGGGGRGSDRLVTNGDKGGGGVKKILLCGDVIFERLLNAIVDKTYIQGMLSFIQ